MGLLAKGATGLGMLQVKGLNLVPKPPARIIDFMYRLLLALLKV